jgi:H+/gluconate symporter-like permease
LRVLFFSGLVDLLGVGENIAESTKITVRVIPSAIVNAIKATIRTALPAREYCKPIAFFILTGLNCNRRAG